MKSSTGFRISFQRLTVCMAGALSLLLAGTSCDKAGAGKTADNSAQAGGDLAAPEWLLNFFAPDPQHRAGRWRRIDERLDQLIAQQAQLQKVSVEDIQAQVKAWTERVKNRESGDPYQFAFASLADRQITVAADQAAKAFTTAMRVKEHRRQDVRKIAQLWAESLMDQDRFADAANAYSRALALTDETQECPLWVQAQESRAYALWRHRRFNDMVQSMRLAVKARKTQPELKGEALCYALVFFGDGLREQKNLTEAQAVLQEAVELMPQLPAFSPVLKYETLCTLGEILSDQGRVEQAQKLLQEAQALTEGTDPPALADPVRASFQLGKILLRQNQLDAAAPLIKQASTWYEEAGKGWEPRLTLCLYEESLLWGKAGRTTETIQTAERLLALMEKTPNAEALGSDFSLSDVCNSLGRAYFQAERFADAEVQLQKAVSLLEQKVGPDHADVAVPLANLSAAIARQGRLTDAEPLIWDAVAIDMRTSVALGKLAPNLVTHTKMFAGIMDAQGVPTEEKSRRVIELVREAQLPDALFQEFAQIMSGK